MSDEELSYLIVDDNHSLIYCFIPKVACTNWKRVLLILHQGKPYADPMSITQGFVHDHIRTYLLNRLPRSEMKAKLQHYTKFLFVREPFVRIISAYRDKLERRDEHFYKEFGQHILRRYGNQSDPPSSAGKAFALGVRPSFRDFIRYLVDPQTEEKVPFEPHWRQMHRLCHPCHIQYDFIGHQETLQVEAEQLLKLLDLQDDIKFPSSFANMTATDSVLDWFKTAPVEDRRKLSKLYESDFRLFSYRKPEWFDG